MRIKSFVNQSPIVGIMATQMALGSYLDKKFAETKLSYLEALVLVTLFFEVKAENFGPSQIARNLLYPAPRISAALSRLHAEGLISRALGQEDSRRIRLRLTDKGSDRAKRAIGIFNSIQNAVENTISETQSLQVNKALLKLRSEVFAY